MDMTGDSEGDIDVLLEPANKKQRVDSKDGSGNNNTTTSSIEVDRTVTTTTPPPPPTTTAGSVVVKKRQLSKWAARLFDPDRPRGLIAPPQTIPLNDEFLKAFGKREKEFDRSIGRSIDIETAIVDNGDDAGNEDDDDQQGKKDKKSVAGRKVKISNLKYTTSAETLQEVCKSFGPVVEVNLIMDLDRQDGPTPLNVGRAFVTFETLKSAKDCVENLRELEGRMVRTSIAEELPKKKSSSSAVVSRYWQKDISTKCFRCGQVGHMEADCLNEIKPRPCPLCAKTDHEMRACPVSRVCFNCGLPGHVSRECSQQRGQPQRRVCSNCFQSGHHRIACRSLGTYAPAHDAICMHCGERGHFLCKEFSFFFSLEGVSCYNCGMRGHLGYDCDRPILEELSRDDRKAAQELESAECLRFEDVEKDVQRCVEKKQRSDRERARSAPPSYRRGGDNNRDSHRSFAPTTRQVSSYGRISRGYNDYSNNSGYDNRRSSWRGSHKRGYY